MTAGEVVSHTWRTKVVFRIPFSRWVLEDLACLVLHVRVMNQAFWGLACLVTYVLVNSYNIVGLFFCYFIFVYIFYYLEIDRLAALVCPVGWVQWFFRFPVLDLDESKAGC